MATAPAWKPRPGERPLAVLLPKKRARIAQKRPLDASSMLNAEVRRYLHHLVSVAPDEMLVEVVYASALPQIRNIVENSLLSMSLGLSMLLNHYLGARSGVSAETQRMMLKPIGVGGELNLSFHHLVSNATKKSLWAAGSLRQHLHKRLENMDRDERETFLSSFSTHEDLLARINTEFPGRLNSFPLSKVPAQIWFRIQDYMTSSELFAISMRVNRQWFYLATCPEYWNRVQGFRFGSRMLGSLTSRSKKENLNALITKLPHLKVAQFGKHLTPDVVDSLIRLMVSKLPRLESLNFSTGTGTDARLSLFTSNKVVCSITSLDLSACSLITDVGLRFVSRGCRALRRINLRDCTRISDAGVTQLVESCVQLEDLVLRYCTQLTDSSLFAIASSSGSLRSLNLKGCLGITDDGVVTVAQSCPLDRISVSKCVRVSNASIDALAHACPHLQYAHFADCPQINDAGVRVLARSCSALRSANLCLCPAVTVEGVLELAKNCPKLEHMCIKGIGLNRNIVAEIQAHVPNIKRVCVDSHISQALRP